MQKTLVLSMRPSFGLLTKRHEKKKGLSWNYPPAKFAISEQFQTWAENLSEKEQDEMSEQKWYTRSVKRTNDTLLREFNSEIEAENDHRKNQQFRTHMNRRRFEFLKSLAIPALKWKRYMQVRMPQLIEMVNKEQQYKIGYNATSWARIRGKKTVLKSASNPKQAAFEVTRRTLGEDTFID